MDWTPRDIAKMIDHSLLRPELTIGDIAQGCEISKKYDVMAVCCAPSDVALARPTIFISRWPGTRSGQVARV
jgi:deoxyribose-phosphate aldolase